MAFNKNRIIFSVIVFLAVLFLSWYVYLFLMLAGMFIFKAYKEGIFFAVISDMLYGFQGGGIFGLSFSTTLIVGFVFIISLFVRDKLRFIYDHA